VLGIACGSLGALSAVMAPQTTKALDSFEAGSWSRRAVPALEAFVDGEKIAWSINDFVLVRRTMGQLSVDVRVGDELYVRLAGDGVIVATALGSSAYSMAAGGPVLVTGTPALVCTPLAMHGGNAPPLVVPGTSSVRVQVHPTVAGFEVQLDGHLNDLSARDYRISLHKDKVTLISFGELGLGLSGLRERRLIMDSARVLARDARERADSQR
jgi:NAD+ kinase